MDRVTSAVWVDEVATDKKGFLQRMLHLTVKSRFRVRVGLKPGIHNWFKASAYQTKPAHVRQR